MLEFLRSKRLADKAIAWKKSRAESNYNKAFAWAQEVDRRREEYKKIDEMKAETDRLRLKGSLAAHAKEKLKARMPIIKERLGKIVQRLGSSGARMQRQSRPRVSSDFLFGPRNPGSPGGTGGTEKTSWHY